MRNGEKEQAISRKVQLIIAEIGNCHFGDMALAKEHIRVAKECGADDVKMQAFKPEDIKGSMPLEFYKKCAFSVDQCLDLMDYAKTNCGISLFFSIFSEGFDELIRYQMLDKISASQNHNNSSHYIYDDEWSLLVSFKKDTPMYPLKQAQILYATEYMPQILDISHITKLKKYYKRRVGLSDHHVGIKACLEAHKRYEIHIIEKHFTLKKERAFNGFIFRDTIHGMDPKELETLARAVK